MHEISFDKWNINDVRSLCQEDMGIHARSGQGPFPAGTQADKFVITETGQG